MSLLTDDIWAEVKPVFAAAYPCEAVVAIYRDGTWEELTNLHAEPWTAFTISHEDNAKLLERDTILLLHSHPNGQAWPSDEDTENQIDMGFAWGIVPVKGQPVSRTVYEVGYPEIWGGEAPISPLEGRQFLWGVRDCWTLAWDYYRLAGHELPPIPRVREPGTHFTDPRKVDPFKHWPEKLGFVRVQNRADRQPGDLAIFSWEANRRNHVAIYLGNATYLHQPEKLALSGKQIFRNEEERLARFSAEFWRLP